MIKLSGSAKLKMVEWESQLGRLVSSSTITGTNVIKNRKFRSSSMEEQQFGSGNHPNGYVHDSPSVISEIFDTWCCCHKKTYPSEEEKLHRFNVFKENYNKSVKRNRGYKHAKTRVMDQYADITCEERSAMELDSNIPLKYFLAYMEMMEGKTPGTFSIHHRVTRDERIQRRTITCGDLSISSSVLGQPSETQNISEALEIYKAEKKKMWDDVFMFRDELTAVWSIYESEDDPYSPLLISKFFELWCRLNEKSYASEEEMAHRFSVFKEKYCDLIELKKAKIPHEMGLDGFADLTFEECNATKLGSPPMNTHLLMIK